MPVPSTEGAVAMAQLKYSVYATPSKLAVSGDLPPGEDRRAHTKRGQAEPAGLPEAAGAPQAIELRHLRYFAAVADAGNFTHAAERMFIAQPTLSQQIRRLEEIVGTPLLQRRREGLRLTPAGTVLLDASRTVLSLVDHGVNRTRQAAGLGRPRLRVVVPPGLPDALAVEAASALRSAAAAADVEIAWLEAPLDAEFSLIRQRRADAAVGWLTDPREALPDPLEVMSLENFEPDVWVPSRHPAARRGTISLGELARMDVIHGPRRLEPGIYDAWTRALRTVNPRFEFTDPPLRHSLPMALTFAATADRPTAVLTGPAVLTGSQPGLIRLPRPMVTRDMVLVGLDHHPLTATAAVVWSGDLPRPLQQILFDAADGITPSAPARMGEREPAATGLYPQVA
jgi:DNA-binding transcriptional LysR family regulator